MRLLHAEARTRNKKQSAPLTSPKAPSRADFAALLLSSLETVALPGPPLTPDPTSTPPPAPPSEAAIASLSELVIEDLIGNPIKDLIDDPVEGPLEYLVEHSVGDPTEDLAEDLVAEYLPGDKTEGE